MSGVDKDEQDDPTFAPDSGPAEMQAFSFSTDAFPEHERIAAWREAFSRTVLGIDVSPRSNAGFQASARGFRAPGIGVIRSHTPAMDMANSRSLISNDGVSLGTVFDGRWRAGQLGRNVDLGPGDAVFMSNSDLGNISLLEESRFVTFGLPRSAAESLGLDLSMLVARKIPANNPALRMLLHYLELAREETIAADLELRAVFSDHVCDLLAIVLGASGDAAELAAHRGIPAARLRAIQDDVRKESGRADLSVNVIAARHGVSARYVQRIFEATGTTFTEYVTEQRLARAYKALRRRAARALSISTIAYDCGFADISHFNRLFRRRFGCTPSDARNGAPGRAPENSVPDA